MVTIPFAGVNLTCAVERIPSAAKELSAQLFQKIEPHWSSDCAQLDPLDVCPLSSMLYCQRAGRLGEDYPARMVVGRILYCYTHIITIHRITELYEQWRTRVMQTRSPESAKYGRIVLSLSMTRTFFSSANSFAQDKFLPMNCTALQGARPSPD